MLIFMRYAIAIVCALALTAPIFYAAFSVGYLILESAHKVGAKL